MSKVDVVEVVVGDGLRQKTRAATAAFRRFFADAPELKLYRAADGASGFKCSSPWHPATGPDSRRRIGP